MKMKIKALTGQFLRFGMIGIIATLIDYAVLFVLLEFFGIYYLIANAVAFTVSVVFNYLGSMKFVFSGREGMSRRKEFVIFVILCVIGLLLNEVLMWIGVDLCHLYSMVSKLFATVVVMLYNFVTRKIFLDAKT